VCADEFFSRRWPTNLSIRSFIDAPPRGESRGQAKESDSL
jgi:hypothetical protein